MCIVLMTLQDHSNTFKHHHHHHHHHTRSHGFQITTATCYQPPYRYNWRYHKPHRFSEAMTKHYSNIVIITTIILLTTANKDVIRETDVCRIPIQYKWRINRTWWTEWRWRRLMLLWNKLQRRWVLESYTKYIRLFDPSIRSVRLIRFDSIRFDSY